MTQADQKTRWEYFGWHDIVCDGNDIDSLDKALTEAKATKGKPTVIIAETTKGYGVSFMENKAPWHHKVPNAEEYAAAKKELQARRAQAL